MLPVAIMQWRSNQQKLGFDPMKHFGSFEPVIASGNMDHGSQVVNVDHMSEWIKSLSDWWFWQRCTSNSFNVFTDFVFLLKL